MENLPNQKMSASESSAPLKPPDYRRLERNLDLKMVIAISIAAMLGSGIFVLPGLAAAKTGSSVWLAYIIAGVCVLPAALSKAELATAMPTSGGTYVYLERAFGPLVGTISGLGLWLALVLKSSFALVGFGAYLEIFTSIPVEVAALTLLSLITTVNILGALKVGQVQILIVALCLLALAVLGITGVSQTNLDASNQFLTNGLSGLFSATAFVFVSFAGVTKIAAISEEVKEPSVNIPRGMILSLSIVTIVYALIVYVVANILPPADLYGDLHPIASLSGLLFGTTGSVIAAIIGVLTMCSMANSGILASSRFPFAMSRDYLLPAFFQRLSKRFKTPTTCILTTGLSMALIILALDIEKIVKLASAFMILMFSAVNVSVIILRQTGVQWYKPEYRSPLYPWMQIFGIIAGLLLLLELASTVVIALIAISLPGTIIYLAFGKQKSDRRGVLTLYRRRASVLFSNRKQIDDRNLPNSKSESHRQIKTQERKRSPVVVPLLGQERSAEMLIEVSSAILSNNWIDVVYISEVPEQTLLTASEEDELLIQSLQRRVEAMSQAENAAINFETVITHDRLLTLQKYNADKNVEWMVMQWDGNASTGILFHKPVGWLAQQLSCNLALFKDAGVRYIRAILVYYKPGPDENLVLETVNRLAALYKASVTFVRVIDPDASEAELNETETALKKYAAKCSATYKIEVIPAKRRLQAITTLSAGYDLLVTGSPNRLTFGRFHFGMKKDYLTRDAACSVLRLRTPRSSITS